MIDISKLPNHAPEYDLEKFLEAGCHFGHQIKKWHPKMAEYIYCEKDGVHIFDLVKTASQLQVAYNYAYNLGKNNKTLIFVGTKRQARDVVKDAAVDCGAMYITSRWLGGFLTNWNQVFKSIKKMNDIQAGLKSGKYKGYTKFERTKLEKQATRAGRFFEGIKGIKSKPDAIFIIDPFKEKIVVHEAMKEGVELMALVDSNGDPSNIGIPIPANDDVHGSVELITNEIAKAYKAGKAAK